MSERVFVTGYAVLSAIGNTIEEFTDSLRQGTSGFRQVKYFDTSAFEFDRSAVLDSYPEELEALILEHPEWETAEHYGVHTVREALRDAGLGRDSLDPFRTGVSVASSNAGVETNQAYSEGKLRGEQLDKVVRTPATVTATIRRDLGLRGPQVAISTACAAGSNSIGAAADLIQSGRADVVIAGAAEPFSLLSFSGFTILKSLTDGVLRPFDTDRNGTGLGEGACILILESESSMIARGAKPRGEILGYGISNDAHHATAPDPEGVGAALAISQCLESARLAPEDVDYINAHGTATRYNDMMELTALTRVFGERLNDIPISSTKPLHGHTLSCAGSLELLVSILALRNNFVPGNANLENQLVEFPDANLPKEAIDVQGFEIALSNSFGFAGNNASIAIRVAADTE